MWVSQHCDQAAVPNASLLHESFEDPLYVTKDQMIEMSSSFYEYFFLISLIT